MILEKEKVYPYIDPETHVIVYGKRKMNDMTPWISSDKFNMGKENGTLLRVNDTNYILTCFHGIKNSQEIHYYSFVKEKSSIQIVKKSLDDPKNFIGSPELDLVLIPIDSKKKTQTVKIESFEMKIPKVGTKLKLCVNRTERENQKIKVSSKEFACTVLKVDFESLISFHRIKIPLLYVDTTTLIDEYPEPSGISGSLVFDQNNRIVGIVSQLRQTDNTLGIIPSCIVHRLIKELIHFGTYKGLCSIVGKTNTIANNFCRDSEIKYGLSMDNTFGINYNFNPYGSSGETGNTLKDLDIITKIDNQTINENCEIYDQNCDYNLPLQTYVALNYLSDDMIPVQVYRSSGTGYRHIKINIKARPFSTTCYLSESFNGRFLSIAGLIFVELSEDLIDFFEDVGYYLIGSVSKYRQYVPYRNTSRSVMALVHIDMINLSSEKRDTIRRLDLPFRNVCRDYYNLPILTKINGKKINSLDSFANMDLNNLTIHCSISNSITVKFVVRGNQVESVKMLRKKKSENKI